MLPLEYGFKSVSIRDVDTQWSKRDAELLNHWLASSYEAHIIRDDYGQNKEIMGGLWGVKSKQIMISDAYIKYIKPRIKRKYNLFDDQYFLALTIYPLISKFGICYTSCNLFLSDKTIYKLREPIIDDSMSGEILSMGQQPSDFSKFMTEDNNEKYYGLSKKEERHLHFNKSIREKNHIFKIFTPRIASHNFFKNYLLLLGYYFSGLISFKELIFRFILYFSSLRFRLLVKVYKK